MSKNKVIVLAVLEGGMSKSEAARRYGVGRQWFHELLARYAAEGDAGLEPRSRRPRTNPQATVDVVRARILTLRTELTKKGLDAGAETIAAHLEREGLTPPARSTIHRILRAAGTVVPEPHKRPRSSQRRFTAAQPNEMWQSDFTYWALADGTSVEILDFIDDHSRYLLHLTAHPKVTGDRRGRSLPEHRPRPWPARLHPDRQRLGLHHPPRRRPRRPQRLRNPHRIPGHHPKERPAPSHPQTQGKIERFHQTLKKWLKNQPEAHTIPDLDELLTKFRHVYNHERPHRALKRRTPSEAYEATPKAAPAIAAQGEHWRIRTDRVDTDGKVTLRHAGRLRHLGIGRAHKHKRIILLVRDADVTAVEHGTGEILAEFTIDPARGYQPKKQNTPGP